MSAIPPWDDRHFPPRENLQNTTNDGLDDSALSRLGINSDIVDDSWDEQETINIDVTETYTPDITPLTTPVIVDEIIIADEINVLNLDANSIQTDLVNINGSIHTTGSAVFDSGVTTSTIYTDNCIFDVEQQNTEIIALRHETNMLDGEICVLYDKIKMMEEKIKEMEEGNG